MSDDVIITMTAQDAQMVAAWQKARQGPADFEKAIEKAGRTAKRAGKEAASGFDDLTQSVAAGATIIGTATTAWQIFSNHLAAIEARQDRIAGRQVDVASAFRRAASVGRELKPDEIFGQVTKVAKSQTMAQDMFAAFEASTSAAGAETTGQAILDAVIASAKQRPDLDQTNRTSLITGALQLQKNFGGNIEEAMASVQQSFGTSRAENLGAFATNVIPTVTALRQMGGGKDSFQDLMGIAVGWGQATNDKTGERGRTDLLTMFRQAKEKAAGKGLVGADAGIVETLAAVQGDAKLRGELLGVFAQSTTGGSLAAARSKMKKGELTVGAASFVAGSELINNAGATPKAIAEAQAANLGMTPAAVAEVEAKQREINESRALRTANLAQERERILTAAELNSGAGIRSEARAVATAAWDLFPQMNPLVMGRRAASSVVSPVVGAFQSDEAFVRGQASDITQSYLKTTGKLPTGELAELIIALTNAADKIADGANNEEVVRAIKQQTAVVKEQAGQRAPRRAPIAGAGDQR